MAVVAEGGHSWNRDVARNRVSELIKGQGVPKSFSELRKLTKQAIGDDLRSYFAEKDRVPTFETRYRITPQGLAIADGGSLDGKLFRDVFISRVRDLGPKLGVVVDEEELRRLSLIEQSLLDGSQTVVTAAGKDGAYRYLQRYERQGDLVVMRSFDIAAARGKDLSNSEVKRILERTTGSTYKAEGKDRMVFVAIKPLQETSDQFFLRSQDVVKTMHSDTQRKEYTKDRAQRIAQVHSDFSEGLTRKPLLNTRRRVMRTGVSANQKERVKIPARKELLRIHRYIQARPERVPQFETLSTLPKRVLQEQIRLTQMRQEHHATVLNRILRFAPRIPFLRNQESLPTAEMRVQAVSQKTHQETYFVRLERRLTQRVKEGWHIVSSVKERIAQVILLPRRILSYERPLPRIIDVGKRVFREAAHPLRLQAFKDVHQKLVLQLKDRLSPFLKITKLPRRWMDGVVTRLRLQKKLEKTRALSIRKDRELLRPVVKSVHRFVEDITRSIRKTMYRLFIWLDKRTDDRIEQLVDKKLLVKRVARKPDLSTILTQPSQEVSPLKRLFPRRLWHFVFSYVPLRLLGNHKHYSFQPENNLHISSSPKHDGELLILKLLLMSLLNDVERPISIISGYAILTKRHQQVAIRKLSSVIYERVFSASHGSVIVG